MIVQSRAASRTLATMSLLEHAADHYAGVIIDAAGLPEEPEAFDASLTVSLKVSLIPLLPFQWCQSLTLYCLSNMLA